MMERIKGLPPIPLFIIMFLILTGTPKVTESQFRPPPIPARPLCLSQFALANHACSLLPYSNNPYEPPPPSEEPDEPDQLVHVTSDHHDDDNNNHNDNDDGQQGRRRHHAHRHRRRHRLDNEQHRRHRHRETPVEEDCCRWLKAVDDQCVCEVLVRLPVFLARPWHRFQVVVDESCNVTYSCAGRVIGV